MHVLNLPGLALDYQRALIAMSPHSRSINVAVPGKLGEVKLELPALAYLGQQERPDRLHPGAVCSLLDTALALAAHQNLGSSSNVATIDMRVDFMRPPLNIGATAIAKVGSVTHRRISAVASLFQSDDREPFGSAVAAFSYSPAPQSVALPSTQFGSDCDRTGESFQEWLGFRASRERLERVEYDRKFAATDEISRYHGGAVAAILTTFALDAGYRISGDAELVGITCSFFKFVEPQAVEAAVRVVRQGRTLATIDVSLYQDGTNPVAGATAQFELPRRTAPRRENSKSVE